MQPKTIGMRGGAFDRVHGLAVGLLLTTLGLWTILPGISQANWSWSEYRRPFHQVIGVPLHGSETVEVMLPEHAVRGQPTIVLRVRIESNFIFRIDGFEQKGFEGFTPKVSMNGAMLFGNYEINVKPLPVRQVAQLRIKTKYLKPGRNTLTFSLWVDPQLQYSCERGSRCIAYWIQGLEFEGGMPSDGDLPTAGAENLACTFEAPHLEAETWNFTTIHGRWTGKGGYQTITVDTSQGARQSRACLAMTFQLGEQMTSAHRQQPIRAVALNRKRRDLSKYSGIEFFVKASRNLAAVFGMADSQPGLESKERWVAMFNASLQWQRIRIDFNTLSARPPAAPGPTTDGRLDPHRIETLFWVIHKSSAPRAVPTSLYIDEIRFY